MFKRTVAIIFTFVLIKMYFILKKELCSLKRKKPHIAVRPSSLPDLDYFLTDSWSIFVSFRI